MAKKGIPISMQLVLAVVGMIVVVMVLGLVKNLLVLPMVNKAWLRSTDVRCIGEGANPLSSSTIGVVVVCNGVASDTAAQVQNIIKRAWCPRRVVIVVVHFGPLQRDKRNLNSTPTVSKLLTTSPLFLGIESEFNISERVVTVFASKAPTKMTVLQGNMVAMGLGMRKLRELGVEFAAFMGPTADAVQDWDNIALEEFSVASKTHPMALLTYAPSKPRMPAPSFPLLGFVGPVPSVTWMPFSKPLEEPHPSKLVASDFLFTRLGLLPQELDETLTRLPCPPRFVDILLSRIFFGMQFAAFAPARLIVNGRFSDNCTRYVAQLAANAHAKDVNARTTEGVLRSVAAPQARAFVRDFLGLDMDSFSVRADAAMGTLPATAGFAREILERDLNLKYENRENFDKTWSMVQRRVANHSA